MQKVSRQGGARINIINGRANPADTPRIQTHRSSWTGSWSEGRSARSAGTSATSCVGIVVLAGTTIHQRCVLASV